MYASGLEPPSVVSVARRRKVPRLPIQERLGARIRELRLAAGKSQTDMVRDHGWTLAHWGRIERGVADARISTIERVANDLGVTLSTLFEGL